MAWSGEGGADTAAYLLSHYDETTDTWDIPRSGHFWEAVGHAESRGRTGAGRTVAVIDDGFDVGISRLATLETPWGMATRGLQQHGTAVALTVLAVAPDVRLLLYPVADRTGWREEHITAALRDLSTRTDVDIVNLSLGQPHEFRDVKRGLGWWQERAEVWDDFVEEDLPIWRRAEAARLEDWRQEYDVPANEVATLVRQLRAAGCLVIAAAGNSSSHLYEPAAVEGAFSVSFHGPRAQLPQDYRDGGTYLPPDFDQSPRSDFSVVQPRSTMGSSFATPMISGFAALMRNPQDLVHYRRTDYVGGLAAEVMMELAELLSTGHEKRWRWLSVFDDLYTQACRSPHTHPAPGVCPKCYLFLLPSYVNFGQDAMNLGAVELAGRILRSGVKFLGEQADLLLLLGRYHALLADSHRGLRQRRIREEHLLQSLTLLSRGLAAHPEFVRDQRLLAAVQDGLTHPVTWELPATFHGL